MIFSGKRNAQRVLILMRKGISVNMRRPLTQTWTLVLLLTLVAAVSRAVPVSHLQVRVVTGPTELSPGSYVELRIYEAGKSVRRYPLTHGEAWARDSTRVIPLTLNDALDPRNVLRFSLFYARRARCRRRGKWWPPMSICRPAASRRSCCSAPRSRERSRVRESSRRSSAM